MAELPTGIVTFCFTDIEGSTRLMKSVGEARYAEVLEACRQVLRSAATAHEGTVVDTEGDGALLAFTDPGRALAACAQMQRALREKLTASGEPVRIRMGMHTGAAVPVGDHYVALAVHQAARVGAAAHGGQVICSAATAAVVTGLPSGTQLKSLGRYRLRDFDEPQEIFQLTGADRDDRFPALRAVPLARHNLPLTRTSFVGRDREVAELTSLIVTEPLVTIVGAGGVGKSRIAVHAATEASTVFSDGVWMVELAEISDADLVTAAIASALGVRPDPQQSLSDTILERLGESRALLVLDNCEHLVDACATLVDTLLSRCAHLSVLATSREPLRLPAERIFTLAPLALPSAKLADPQPLLEYEAVRLFVQRATLADRTFQLTAENAAAVAEVCRRLDGIPLAIELAAARVRHLSPPEIAKRLEDRFSLLSRGSRVALPHQQTLRALVDWSHDLLSPTERAVLRRLAVLAGGFDLSAAEAVSAFGDVESGEVFDSTSALADKSLLTIRTEDGIARYAMLETIRAYGLERLKASGEDHTARVRHAAWCLDLVGRADKRAESETLILDRLDREDANFRAALAWTLGVESSGASAHELGASLAAALGPFWYRRGHWVEGSGWLQAALAQGESLTAGTRLRALWSFGVLLDNRGDHAQAASLFAQALELARATADQYEEAKLLNSLGVAAYSNHDYKQSRVYFEEALVLKRQVDRASIATTLFGLAQVNWAESNRKGARESLAEALTHDLEAGDEWGVMIDQMTLGDYARLDADPEAARNYYRDALGMLRQIKDPDSVARILIAIVAMDAELLGEGSTTALKAVATELLTTLGSDWKDVVADLQVEVDLTRESVARPTASASSLEDAIRLGLEALR